jgi:hypothetical protein
MEKATLLIMAFLLFLSFVSCDSDDSYYGTMVYGECIPNYVYPPDWVLEEGQAYYHKRHVVIIYAKGNWLDSDATIITKNQLLIE